MCRDPLYLLAPVTATGLPAAQPQDCQPAARQSGVLTISVAIMGTCLTQGCCGVSPNPGVAVHMLQGGGAPRPEAGEPAADDRE